MAQLSSQVAETPIWQHPDQMTGAGAPAAPLMSASNGCRQLFIRKDFKHLDKLESC